MNTAIYGRLKCCVDGIHEWITVHQNTGPQATETPDLCLCRTSAEAVIQSVLKADQFANQ